jgi:hypothetical protein
MAWFSDLEKTVVAAARQPLERAEPCPAPPRGHARGSPVRADMHTVDVVALETDDRAPLPLRIRQRPGCEIDRVSGEGHRESHDAITREVGARSDMPAERS